MRSRWVSNRRRDHVRGSGVNAREIRAVRSDEALAADGVARTCLGYEVLVKLKMDELLDQACVRMPVAA
jgi:hypothetical protein